MLNAKPAARATGSSNRARQQKSLVHIPRATSTVSPITRPITLDPELVNKLQQQPIHHTVKGEKGTAALRGTSLSTSSTVLLLQEGCHRLYPVPIASRRGLCLCTSSLAPFIHDLPLPTSPPASPPVYSRGSCHAPHPSPAHWHHAHAGFGLWSPVIQLHYVRPGRHIVSRTPCTEHQQTCASHACRLWPTGAQPAALRPGGHHPDPPCRPRSCRQPQVSRLTNTSCEPVSGCALKQRGMMLGSDFRSLPLGAQPLPWPLLPAPALSEWLCTEAVRHDGFQPGVHG